jgi:PKD repeat protein
MLQKYLILLALLYFPLSGLTQTPDPGIAGEYAVSSDEYDFGDEAFDAPTFPDLIEVTGSVHYPTDMSDGPFPVLVFLHGRHSTCFSGGSTSIAWPCTGTFDPIPSYQGYDYLAEQMASHGYIVISISANSISSTDNGTPDYGMRARGELIQHHLDLWNEWNTTDDGPFGDLFIDKLDLNNVGTMGHSRGGEGVIEHALYNRELGRPYGLNAVLTLAPVDFNRPVLNGIPILNIAPYCDGDVSDLQGVHFYDDARYNDPDDTTAKHNILMLGANHNYFNTVWTPGLFPAGTADDWRFVDAGQDDQHCGTDSPDNGRYDPATQRNALLAYASAFFRVYIGGEEEFAPILKTTDTEPPVSSTLTNEDVFVSYHPPTPKRIDVNRLDSEETEITNTVDGTVSETGLVTFDICGDDFGEQYCIGAGTAQEPHNKNGGVAILGLSQLEIAWNSLDDTYQNDIPPFLQDFTQFEAVQFRAAVNFDTSPFETALDFSIVLIDNDGASSALQVTDYSSTLFFPPGDWGATLPRTMHNTISIPTEDFSGIDMTNIASIRFDFDQVSNGGILISDLILSAGDDILFPPIADFASNVTTTCTGEVQFTDESSFYPSSWLWNFGDGETSTDEDPVHIYDADGVYTVTLTVTNEAGTDSETFESYIIVDKPEAPFAEDVTACEIGGVTLNATGTGGLITWHDSIVDGALVGTGEEYIALLTETTNFYVQETIESPIQSVGPEDNTFGGGGFFGANDLRGIFFDAHAPFILETVKVYANTAGNRTIQVLDGEGGSVIHSTVVNIPVGESIVDLNFEIDPYDGYYIKVSGGLVDLFRINDGSPSYPYEIPGLVSLTGSNVFGEELNFYYFFFDWQVREPNCVSSRTMITATLVPTDSITANASDSTICFGEEITLFGEGAESYEWDLGVTDGEPFVPEASATYTVTGTIDDCTGTSEVTIIVNPLPSITVSDDITIIGGESTTLSASGGTTYSWSPATGLDDPTSASPIATPSETTTYMVTVTDDNGCTSTGEVTVTIEGQLGIAEVEQGELLLQPNPSTGLITITIPTEMESGIITIYTVEGKLIVTKNMTGPSTQLDLSRFARGTYYIRFENDQVSTQEKLILQ